jgi:O-6-methylguanine DNA methyltransferase
MITGALAPSLGLYILIHSEGRMIKQISFSQLAPESSSRLAEEIAAYAERGGSFPQAELDFSGCTKFQKKIYVLVKEIPRGCVMTYGQVAEKTGCFGAARAVGRALAANPFPILIPCHRVLARDGMGGFSFGLEIKGRLLELEGYLRS